MQYLNQISLTQWIVGLGILFILCVIVVLIRNWMEQVKDYEYRTEQAFNDLTDNESVKALLKQGYIFCFFWRVEHIHAVGLTMGVYLTDQDCVKVTSLIKDRFNPETGISNDVIRGAILEYTHPDGIQNPLTFEDYGH